MVRFLLFVSFFFPFFTGRAAINYTVYLESWDSEYVDAYQGVVTSGESDYQNYNGVTLNISFAAFVFTPAEGFPTNMSGLYGTSFGGGYGGQDALVSEIIEYVHAHGGKVQLAYGGNSYAAPYAPNYFITQTTQDGGWPHNIMELATGVAATVNALGFDGVDFDIEDPQPVGFTPQQVAADLTAFLQAVRAALPTKTITLTIPAQAWKLYWQYLAQNVSSIDGLVDGINFMEYDIWINPSLANGYVEQVEADIVTYTSPTNQAPAPNWAQGWGINPELIQLGIMPGNDDTQQLMTAANAAQLTTYAAQSALSGVFIWDINRDATTVMTPVPFYPSTPYAFTNAIRGAILHAPDASPSVKSVRNRSRRFISYDSLFQKQINPKMGQPPYEP